MTDIERIAILEAELAAMRERYNKPTDKGRNGRHFEIDGRAYLTKKIERVHREGYTDCFAKRGVSIEFKNGSGSLSYGFDSKEEATEALATDNFLKHCTHVCYIPKYSGENLGEALVFSRKVFIKLLREFNLLRVRRETDGLYRVAIQSYIPTPKFKASQARYDNFVIAMQNNGRYLDIFADDMKIETADFIEVF